jgi:hypothetical protein
VERGGASIPSARHLKEGAKPESNTRAGDEGQSWCVAKPEPLSSHVLVYQRRW